MGVFLTLKELRKWSFSILSALLLLGGIGLNLMWPAALVFGEENEVESLPSLQELVDQAKPGELIVMGEQKYAGPVRIDKPITIDGSKAALVNDQAVSAIIIASEGVAVRGLRIAQQQGGEELAAVTVQADDFLLQDLRITTSGFGIVLRDADRGALMNNLIAWDNGQQGTVRVGEKGNGIDLYNSHENRLEGNRILRMRDGIYLENSTNLDILNNSIAGSRYGIHCMYIDGTQIIGNSGEYNMTGAMVMGVTNVRVAENSFTKQSANVYSQGILLYDVQSSVVEKNIVDGNRVGIYLEMSSDNELMNNSIYRNFVGIQLVDAENNLIHHNDFVANVIEAEARDSGANRIELNYWDSAQVLDLNRDGVSELGYAMNPFYAQLVSRDAAYQLFFQSPGMSFLSGMYEGERSGWTTDLAPQISPNMPRATSGALAAREYISETAFMAIIASMLLLTSLLTIIYSGGRKS